MQKHYCTFSAQQHRRILSGTRFTRVEHNVILYELPAKHVAQNQK